MSRIYFHSEHDTAELKGSERAWMGGLSDDIGLSLLSGYNLRSVGEWLTLNLFGKAPDAFRLNSELLDTARLALRHDDGTGDRVISYQGVDLSPWSVSLNTALRLGSRPVKLATRLHAQCEMHAWVDGPARAWLADIIDEGLKARVLRHPAGDYDPGWAALAAFFRADSSGPVVTSYSVTDEFPNREAAGWEGDPDDWYDLPAQERWDTAMAGLRARDGFLQIRPDDFDDYVFGHNGLTWMDILEGEARLREVLELEPAEANR